MVGAMSVFGELQTALDRIWRVPPRPLVSGAWRVFHSRLRSFAMVACTGALVLAWLTSGAVLAALGQRAGDGRWVHAAAQIVELAVGFALISAMFAMIYKIVPNARIAWRDVWIGAWVTAALFSAGKFLIALYIGKSGVSSAFGAAGSLAALLVWLYYSAQIFLLGAEFTWVYAHRFGSRRDAVGPGGRAFIAA
jgi:membrane protein